MTYAFKVPIFILAGAFSLMPFVAAAAPSLQCTFLTMDLRSGASDSSAHSQVTLLQNFLAAKGYLTSTPNGYFGPGTFAAVKSFQSASGISITGTAGPLTRAAIQKLSCTTTAQVPAPASTASVPVQPNQPNQASSAIGTPSRTVTSPASGQALTAGSNFTISWAAALHASYDILLEDEYGSSVGRIASASSGTTYSWAVGTVHASNGASDRIVAPGTYRIRLQNAAGIASSDQISDQFTIVPSPITVSTFMPQSVRNNASDAVVLYGSGFDVATSVFFDALYGASAPILYLSTDGKVLVFAVPTNVPAGTHSIAIKNQYTSSSNVASILVKDTAAAQ